jgi:hypothetical protein
MPNDEAHENEPYQGLKTYWDKESVTKEHSM